MLAQRLSSMLTRVLSASDPPLTTSENLETIWEEDGLLEDGAAFLSVDRPNRKKNFWGDNRCSTRSGEVRQGFPYEAQEDDVPWCLLAVLRVSGEVLGIERRWGLFHRSTRGH